MLIIDPRSGSGELQPLFRPLGVDTSLQSIEAADFLHYGNGPSGLELIGYERKALGDMISSMRDKRLTGHQFPAMMEMYQQIYIIVEGKWRIGATGAIEVPRWGRGKLSWGPMYAKSKSILYTELDHYQAEYEHKYGYKVTFAHTQDQNHTAAFIASRYRFWNDREWNQHDRTNAIYSAYDPSAAAGGRRAGFVRRTVPYLEYALSDVDGIDKAAYVLAKKFGSMERLMGMTVEQIARTTIEQNGKAGKRSVKLGESKACRIYEALREKA